MKVAMQQFYILYFFKKKSGVATIRYETCTLADAVKQTSQRIQKAQLAELTAPRDESVAEAHERKTLS